MEKITIKINGKEKNIDLPDYGSLKIVMIGGKIDRIETNKSEKIVDI